MPPKICFYEDDRYRNFDPISALRPVYAMRAGILPLFRRAERVFQKPDICLCSRGTLAAMVACEFRDYPVNIIKRVDDQPVLFINGRLRNFGDLALKCQSGRLVTRLATASGGTAGMLFPPDCLGTVPQIATADQYQILYNENANDLAELETTATLYEHCWEIVNDIEDEISADFEYLRLSLSGLDQAHLHKGVHILGPENLHVGAGVEVFPGALLDASHGPVYIGDGTKVDSQAAIYGPCFIGPNSLVVAGKIAGCSIGHTCRVGGEIEESVFHSYVNKYHAGFIGHSYVGSWVNFGAMTTNSDLKNNYSNIRVSVNGELIDTGSIKVGSFIGDHTKFGIGTLLNTGINIGVSCNLYGGTLIADKEVPAYSWGNSSGYQTYQFDKAIKTARATTERRHVTLSPSEEELLQMVAEKKQEDDGVMIF